MNIFNQIGNTPLIEFSGIVPNKNRIWLKLECENPYGSHYDRVYKLLFKQLEMEGVLKPGCRVLETTSGTAGVSFAAIGRELGYECIVAIPAGGEKAREEAIIREGAKLIHTPADKYISGFPAFLRRYLVENKGIIFLNHSMGFKSGENTKTTAALAEIAIELRHRLQLPRPTKPFCRLLQLMDSPLFLAVSS
jgi:cysteine synthase